MSTTSSPAPASSPNLTAFHRFLRDASMGAILIAAMGLSACGGRAEANPGAAATASFTTPRPAVSAATQVEAGRYLVKIGGCNDCHTVGYVETNGASPVEAEWLTGSPVGYSGPWGTSYAPNLRLSLNQMTEDQFLELAHAGQGRPPMPWPSLMSMSDQDLKAIYAYVRYLGPHGSVQPAALPPGVKPQGPALTMVPH
jgi:mono/diheme cytochrome c family protein